MSASSMTIGTTRGTSPLFLVTDEWGPTTIVAMITSNASSSSDITTAMHFPVAVPKNSLTGPEHLSAST